MSGMGGDRMCTSQHFLEDVEEFWFLDESVFVLVDGVDEFVDFVGVGETMHVQLREHICHQLLHLLPVQGPTVVGVVADEDHVHDLP